jgi:hypothetical protein
MFKGPYGSTRSLTFYDWFFCEMNSQSLPLPLTNIQIKSTQSATTYKYNQTYDSHKYNDMQWKSRGLMRQVLMCLQYHARPFAGWSSARPLIVEGIKMVSSRVMWKNCWKMKDKTYTLWKTVGNDGQLVETGKSGGFLMNTCGVLWI